MRDYTYKIYNKLIETLISASYEFITFEQYCANKATLPLKFVILRHDIDRLPENALVMAKMENSKNIKSSYYYRVVKGAYNEDIIKKITALGHETGYHYEDMDLTKGDVDLAYKSYLKNLERFRQFYPVRTVCMHGSPMSKYDNKDVWKKYDYKKDNIIGEPYFDIDYNQLFYITDTGRQWNNSAISVRDKVNSKYNIKIDSTKHLIELIKQNLLPDQLMINTHPQRWFDNTIPWVKEYILQNVKNVVKRALVTSRK